MKTLDEIREMAAAILPLACGCLYEADKHGPMPPELPPMKTVIRGNMSLTICSGCGGRR